MPKWCGSPLPIRLCSFCNCAERELLTIVLSWYSSNSDALWQRQGKPNPRQAKQKEIENTRKKNRKVRRKTNM